MKTKYKKKLQRVTVSLPEEMVENFKLKSEATGLSVSRLVYLQLHSRKPIIIIGHSVTTKLQELCQMISDIKAKGFDNVNLMLLQQEVEYMRNLVDFDSEVVKCHLKKL